MQALLHAVKGALPIRLRYWLGASRVQLGRTRALTDRLRDFSELRRLTPYRRGFGWHHGECIDRYYIARFIASHANDVRGHVMEIGDSTYAKKFGRGVERIDILDRDAANARATLVADLTQAQHVPDASFDAILCVQTLQFIFDVRAALTQMHRMLKPGGVLLVTVPGISQVCPPELQGLPHDYWRFTGHALRELAQASGFGVQHTHATSFGNVYTATGFLHGLVTSEFTAEELDFRDGDYPLITALHARKAQA